MFMLHMASPATAEGITIGGSGTGLGTMRVLADAFAQQSPGFQATVVLSLGTGGSIKALAAGAIDLAVTARPLKIDERALGIEESEYARTPFLFAMSATSKVTAITTAELAQIYAGSLSSWPDGTPVRVVLRPVSDSDTEFVQSLSPDVARALAVAQQRRGVAFAVNDQDAATDIERIAGAIGPSSLALLVSEKRKLRTLKLNGVEPSPANAASGVYPYYKRMFFVTSAKTPAKVQPFMAFVRSPAGRKILAQTGHWIP
jgi:phosphate transport system substrate-binding protein